MSPAEYYKDVPADFAGNLAYREWVQKEALKSRRRRMALLEMCRNDLLYYVSVFVWQYNPKKVKTGERIVEPFIPWPYQPKVFRSMLSCYERQRPLVIEKSRELGATWMLLILEDWLCQTQDYIHVINISRSADAVDCRSMDSLFAKVRFMHGFLPEWLRGDIDEQKMHLEYHRTHSSMTGEASTGKATVSGRASLIGIDEFSKIREAVEVRERTASTADCRIFISTHEGTGTEFYKLTTDTPEFEKIVLHWTQHPEKNQGLYRFAAAENKIEVLDKTHVFPVEFPFVYSEEPAGGPFPGLRSPWYDQMCSDIGNQRGVAVELDINPSGSVSQVFPSLLIRTLKAQYVKAPLWEGTLHYDRESGRNPALLKREGGPLKLWLNPDAEGGPPVDDYALGVDPAEGSGATNSCISGLSKTTGEKILEYATPFVDAVEFGTIAVALCRLFKDGQGEPAELAWEDDGPGERFKARVLELGFRHVYCRESLYSLNAKRGQMVPGWYPSPKNKVVLMIDYLVALTKRQCINRSGLALDECLHYRWTTAERIEHSGAAESDDPTEARVNHGDRVVADALAWMLCKRAGKIVSQRGKEPAVAQPGSFAWRFALASQRDQQHTETY